MNGMSERVVMITGAASGIGRATAELLAARGARVAAVDQEAHALSTVAAAIGASGGHVVPFAFDLVDRTDSFAAQVAERWAGSMYS